MNQLTFASAGQFVARGSSIHPRRCLDSHVLLIGCAGSFSIVQNGREFIIGEGDFLLLRAGWEHYGSAPASAGQSHFWCHFHLPADQLAALPESGRVTELEKYTILFRQLIDAAYREYADPVSRQTICSAYTSILLTELADDCMAARRREGRGTALTARMHEWIRLHACEGITPRDAAAHFQYSGDYLNQVFRAASGMTVCAFINRCRLNEAKKLLLNSDLRIGEIASRAGFGDEKYFMKVFRRVEQVTPSEYRQSCARIHMNSD